MEIIIAETGGTELIFAGAGGDGNEICVYGWGLM